MSSLADSDFGGFKALLTTWQGAYVCAIHSYIVIKTSDGPRLLYGRVILEPSRLGVDETPFRLETKHLIAGRSVRPIATDDVFELVEQAKAGEMIGIDGPLRLGLESGRPLSTYFAPIYHPFVTDGPRLPSLIVRGLSKHSLLATAGDGRQLDWEMRASDVPFETLDELLGNCQLPPLGQIGDSTTLEIVARSPGAIGVRSAIIAGQAVIECRIAKALEIGKLRLGYRILGKDQKVDRGSVVGDTFHWHGEGDSRVASHGVSVGDAPLLQAFLSYDRVPLHQGWISDPKLHLNPRDAIHQVFDQDHELIRKMVLTPETDRPYVFEEAISTLLNLLGFSISNYGRIPKLQRGPDIIAVSPLGHMAIVECTVGLLNENDKLAKLVQRTRLIKGKLAEAGYGHLRLQAAIVTPRSRNEVVADLPMAGEHGICVVCKEDLEQMLNQVTLFPNADRILEQAKRLVPESGQQSPFRGSM